VLTVVFLEGGFGEGAFAFVNWNVAMWSTFAAIGLLNGVISRVFGFTLEPAGRMELGDYDDDAERGDAVKGNER
jgi:hypothetical protein